MLNDEAEDIAWSSILFVTGEIIYGGRVTDNHDRKTLNIILQNYLNAEVIDIPEYKFSFSGTYHAVEVEKMEDILSYVNTLPDNDPPEIFGMNENANIAV